MSSNIDNDDFDNNLATKMDALLARHRTQDVAATQDVPLLTEIVSAPEWTPSQPEAVSGAEMEGNVLNQLNAEELDNLSHQIFNRVLDKLDKELSVKLEQRLTEQLASQINVAVTHVIADM